ncbi:MAG: hypothetical protein PWR23_1617 [Peptostreptococcaceae bacterium]|jgi:Flp pilus assembly protein TadD|nr:hypothetical protein [Peptostreptococcaceae bacterium]
MELQLKFQILSKILDNIDEIIKVENNLSSFINVEKDILIKDNQIFFEFYIQEDVEKEILKSIIEHYEIAMQILINQGYKIYVYNSQEKYSNICRDFVQIFKDESIRYIENKDNNLKLILESKYTIMMSEEYFLLSFLLEKPCIAMFMGENLLSLLEINNNTLIKKEGFNASVLLDKVTYVEENYPSIKENIANLFKKSRKEIIEKCDELVDIKNQNYGNEKQIIHDENSDDMETYKNQLKQKIQFMIEQGQLEEAKQIVAQYEQIVKDDIDVYSIRGVIAMMEGDMDGANANFKKGLALDEKNVDLNYNLAYLYQSAEKVEEAIYYYKKALQNAAEEKDQEEIYSNLKELGVKDNKEDILQHATVEDNKILHSEMTKSSVKEELEAYKKQFKENIQSLIEQGLLQEAKNMVEEYEKIVKDDVDIYSIKGVVAMMEGDMDGAERVLHEGYEIKPFNFDILYNIAYLYEINEKYITAYRYYKKALKLADEKDIDDISMKVEILEKN